MAAVSEPEVYSIKSAKEEFLKELYFKYRNSSIKKVDLFDSDRPLAYVLCKEVSGDMVGERLSGKGRLVFNDGQVYQGDFRDGVMEGCGVYQWKDGTTYAGQLEDCTLTGIGKYTWKNGSEYVGAVVNGVRHGEGVCKPKKAGIPYYTGSWINGQRTGYGEMIYDEENLCHYKGEWLNGKKHGKGVMQYRSGNVYVGEWAMDCRHGYGTMEWKVERESYTGHWKNGLQDGEGEHLWLLERTDNSQYPMYNRYVGCWAKGQRSGKGTFYYANGAFSRGEWARNRKHGLFLVALQNGSSMECLFDNDKLVQSAVPAQKSGSSLQMGAMHLSRLQTKTPLSSLIGDIDLKEKSGQRTEKFNISISKLIPSGASLEHELKQVHCIILRHISTLKRLYHLYTNLGNISGEVYRHSGALTLMQLWRLMKDTGLHRHGYTLVELSELLEVSGEVKNFATPILMREYLQFLVHLSAKIYLNHAHLGDHAYQRDQLSKCFNELITDHFHLKKTSVGGLVWSAEEVLQVARRHHPRALGLYSDLSSKEGEPPSIRSLLLVLLDCQTLKHVTSSRDLVSQLIHDIPLAEQDGFYNLNVIMTYLEFYEALFRIAALDVNTTARESSELGDLIQEVRQANQDFSEVALETHSVEDTPQSTKTTPTGSIRGTPTNDVLTESVATPTGSICTPTASIQLSQKSIGCTQSRLSPIPETHTPLTEGEETGRDNEGFPPSTQSSTSLRRAFVEKLDLFLEQLLKHI